MPRTRMPRKPCGFFACGSETEHFAITGPHFVQDPSDGTVTFFGITYTPVCEGHIAAAHLAGARVLHERAFPKGDPRCQDDH